MVTFVLPGPAASPDPLGSWAVDWMANTSASTELGRAGCIWASCSAADMQFLQACDFNRG